MKIAIPTADGKLAMHFGHCEKFTIVDTENEKVINKEEAIPPPHEPGVLPKWLKEKNVQAIIAGGMGQRAQSLFSEAGIKVTVGAPSDSVDELVEKYLNDTLETGVNYCDH